MLEYDRIDISEGIDVDKTNSSKECDICVYWYFLDKGFKGDYRIHFLYVSKDDAIPIMKIMI